MRAVRAGALGWAMNDGVAAIYVAEIGERKARGEIAALFGDIRRCIGVGMVNLIYRRMAARPGVLPWAWGALRPHFASGAVASEAGALSANIDTGDVAATPREAWFAAGLNDRSLRAVGGIIDAYNRANLANLVAIGALAAFLENGGAARAPDADRAAGADRALDAGEATGPLRLPPIRDMAELDESTAALIRLLSAPLSPPEAPLTPSLFLHLAPWPAFLAVAAASALAPERTVAAAKDGKALHDRAKGTAARLASSMAPAAGIAAPDEAELAALAVTARRFAEGPIAGMAVLGRRLRAALPEIPAHRP